MAARVAPHWRLATGALVFALGGLACQAIAGIEDRELDVVGSAGSALCDAYCDEVMANCTGEFAVYASRETCLGVCAKLPAGESGDRSGNTVECRRFNAAQAKANGEVDVHCPAAGPGGTLCGGNCEGYCTLLEGVCPAVFDGLTQERCVETCGGLRTLPGFDVEAHHDGDSLNCRLVHVSSATLDAQTHCPHASPAPVNDSPCGDPVGTKPDCKEYCKLNIAACTGELTMYESQKQCEAVCAELALGEVGETTEDTVACRKYHSYSAIAAPSAHCTHAGAGGDGHCGSDNCDAYCLALEKACPAEFASLTASQSCENSCLTIAGGPLDTHQSFEDGDTVQCRMKYLSRQLEDPTATDNCASAVGNGNCQ